MTIKQEESVHESATESTPATDRKRKTPWVILALTLLGAAAIWYAMAAGSAATEPEPETVETPDFEEAVLTDLIEVTEYDGTLGRLIGDPVKIRLSGTVTSVPVEDTVIEQGDPIIWVDNRPVILLYGELPAWRSMQDDTEGPDVLQLESALAALGFDEAGDMTIDEEFTSYTESIVTDWQEAMGAEADGIVDLGEVVFATGPVTVDTLLVEVGDVVNAGAEIFSTSSSEIQITFDLPTTEEENLAVGDTVEVTLPDLSTTTGTVTEIASIATRAEGVGQATYEVEVALDDPAVAAGIEEAPVTVSVITDRADSVIAVPVEALLALAEGGYAVEIQDGSGTRLVGVDTGFYADGLIEVTGAIEPGDLVVVP